MCECKSFIYFFQSDGVAETRRLAEHYVSEATQAIYQLNASPPRTALVQITEKVLNRQR